MNTTQKQTLTDKILTSHEQVLNCGRTSVPFAIECGKYLNEMCDNLPRGEWMDFQYKHKNILSVSTIRRYRKVYEYSLVNNLDGLTLDDIYILIGEKKKPKPTPDDTDDNDTSTTNNETDVTEEETPIDKLRHHVQEIIRIVHRELSPSEKVTALEDIRQSFMSFYNDEMNKVVELKEAA